MSWGGCQFCNALIMKGEPHRGWCPLRDTVQDIIDMEESDQ